MTLRKFLRRLFGRPRKFIPMDRKASLLSRAAQANINNTTLDR